jgi:hypothetical protein
MTKKFDFFITFIFYHRAVTKKDHYLTFLSSYANIVLWCSHCKIHRYEACSSTPGRQCSSLEAQQLSEILKTPVFCLISQNIVCSGYSCYMYINCMSNCRTRPHKEDLMRVFKIGSYSFTLKFEKIVLWIKLYRIVLTMKRMLKYITVLCFNLICKTKCIPRPLPIPNKRQNYIRTCSNPFSFKGQCHEIFCFWFFSWISFPPAPEYSI